MKESETNSGAAAIPYRIDKQYLGECTDDLTLTELTDMAKFAGGDFALELMGEKLHLFRLLVREVRA